MADIDNTGTHQLIVSFPDQSASFAYGFEAGKLWADMLAGKSAEIETVTRIENREVIQRMCVAEGWHHEYRSSEIEGWDYTTLRKTKTAPVRPNPTGLRVVKP